MVKPLVHEPLPRGVQVALLVVAAVVLASHLFFVTGLVTSGVTWRGDPDEAYGVAGNQALDGLPRWVMTPVSLVMIFSVLLGPVVVLVGLLAAVATTWTTWRAEHRLALLAASTVVLAVALGALLATWGSELWIWVLD